MIQETENPFHDSEDEAEAAPKNPSPPPQDSSSSSSRPFPVAYPQPSSTVQSFSHTKSSSRSGSSFFGSSKDKKKDKNKKKSRPFNLAAEKDAMKVAIAESSIAATNLSNSLQSINREQERISENATAVQRFEACKKLRRKIIRYVSIGGSSCNSSCLIDSDLPCRR